jgi:hypothetical protein
MRGVAWEACLLVPDLVRETSVPGADAKRSARAQCVPSLSVLKLPLFQLRRGRIEYSVAAGRVREAERQSDDAVDNYGGRMGCEYGIAFVGCSCL